MEIVNPTNIKVYSMIQDVQGLRENTYNVNLYCYENDTRFSLTLVSSYKIFQKKTNDDDDMFIYRLKFEDDISNVVTMIATCFYNNKNYKFNYSLKNEDNEHQYIICSYF